MELASVAGEMTVWSLICRVSILSVCIQHNIFNTTIRVHYNLCCSFLVFIAFLFVFFLCRVENCSHQLYYEYCCTSTKCLFEVVRVVSGRRPSR